MATSRLPVFTERFTMLRGEMTQSQFADMLGLSRPTISLYESGQRIPGAAEIKVIAEKCNVSADYLLGLRDDPTTDKDVQFISDYTGLSGDAIEMIHSFAEFRNDSYTARYLNSFDEFITCFYKPFLDILGHLKDVAEDADETLQKDGKDSQERQDCLQLCLESLQIELFLFSQLCNKIPRILFDSESILEELEQEINRIGRIINAENATRAENPDNDLPF